MTEADLLALSILAIRLRIILRGPGELQEFKKSLM